MLESNTPAARFLAGLKNWKIEAARRQKWKCVKFDNSFRVQVPAIPQLGIRRGFYWRRASGYGNLPGLCLPHGIRGEVSKMTKIEFSQNQDLSEPKWPGGIRDHHGKSSVASWLLEQSLPKVLCLRVILLQLDFWPVWKIEKWKPRVCRTWNDS